MKYSTDIVIHINDDLDTEHRNDLSTKVKTIRGVESAELAENKSHLMIVAYNAAETKAQEVLKGVRNSGTEAQLVGWL